MQRQRRYPVEDGMLTGMTVQGGPNSFLCTDREYANVLIPDAAIKDVLVVLYLGRAAELVARAESAVRLVLNAAWTNVP
jgi:hypothetical protein